MTGAKGSREKEHAQDEELRGVELRRPVAAVLVVVLSIVIVTLLPGAIAYQQSVFFSEDMASRLPPLARAKNEEHEKQKARQEAWLSRIDAALDTTSERSEEFSQLLRNRAAVVGVLSSSVPPVQAYAFTVTRSSQFFLPVFFISIGWLAFVFRPRLSTALTRRDYARSFAVGAGIYAIWQAPHWVRNFVLGEHLRTVYAYTNVDISPPSFVYQELELFILSWMLAFVWVQWAAFAQERVVDLEAEARVRDSDPLDPDYVIRVAETFSQWQTCSVVLAMFFGAVFLFYWGNIERLKDGRYMLSALVIHVVGLVTWAIVSRPLLVTWQHWSKAKARAIWELAGRGAKDDSKVVELRLSALESTHPVSLWGAAASGALVFVSLVAPLLQMFMH